MPGDNYIEALARRISQSPGADFRVSKVLALPYLLIGDRVDESHLALARYTAYLIGLIRDTPSTVPCPSLNLPRMAEWIRDLAKGKYEANRPPPPEELALYILYALARAIKDQDLDSHDIHHAWAVHASLFAREQLPDLDIVPAHELDDGRLKVDTPFAKATNEAYAMYIARAGCEIGF